MAQDDEGGFLRQARLWAVRLIWAHLQQSVTTLSVWETWRGRHASTSVSDCISPLRSACCGGRGGLLVDCREFAEPIIIRAQETVNEVFHRSHSWWRGPDSGLISSQKGEERAGNAKVFVSLCPAGGPPSLALGGLGEHTNSVCLSLWPSRVSWK